MWQHFSFIIINKYHKVTFHALAVSIHAGLQILIQSQLNFCNMKKTTLAAMLIAASSITFVSCDWFKSKPKNPTPSIVGSWKIDSLYSIGKDSNLMAPLIYALAKQGKDSASIGLQFNADSTFIELPMEESKPKKYYVKDKEIFIQEDSTFKPHQLSFTGDSIASILSKDSTLVVLKRK
jgi:hypothetical protein